MVYYAKKYVHLLSEAIRKTIYMFYSLLKMVLLSKIKYGFPVVKKAEVIVVGNAPSFLQDFKAYPDFFKTRELICVNNFPSSDLYVELKPKYLLILDSAFYWEESNVPAVQKTLKALVERTSWELTIFIPQLGRKSRVFKKVQMQNSFIKVRYYNYTVVDGFDWFNHRIFRLNLGMPLAKNVIVAAIFAAINMRYKKIFLTGVDNSQFKDIAVDKDNELYASTDYFYAKDGEKWRGQLYNNLEKREKMDVTSFFKWCYNNFLAYKKLNVYSKHMGVQVINTTEQSYIDAFERKSLSEL